VKNALLVAAVVDVAIMAAVAAADVAVIDLRI
jgi:hypothetical protein